MGTDLIYPIVNLFQYSLREGLDDDEDKKLERAKVFYSKFFDNIDHTELQEYRKLEQADREFNANLIKQEKLALRKPLDGSRNAIQLGDTYALHFNLSGQSDDLGQPDKSHQDSETVFRKLKKIAEVENLLPSITGSFGQTWLLIAFVDNPQANKLEIAKKCYDQIDHSSPNPTIDQGNWHGGEVFEFWTQPLSYQSNLSELINAHPHVIVWLLPIDKVDDIEKVDKVIGKTYHHWIKLLHYRHKIFFAYHHSQHTIENRLKSSGIREISGKLKSNPISLHHLQKILLNSLEKFQEHSSCIQFLDDQHQTIEINRDNYRLRCEQMAKEDPQSNLGFLLEFEAKISNKYQRQISADRAYLNSSLKVIENLSQTIQSTVQIERAKSDRTTNLTIAAAGIGLATSQVVCAIVLAQKTPDEKTPFYQTSAFQVSLISGAIPIGFLLIYLFLVKVQNSKSAKR